MTLTVGAPGFVGMSAARVEALRGLLHRWVDNGDQQAFVAVIARKGRMVLREACGSLTPAPGSAPVRLDTLFPLSSLSKPITAIAAMILVEEGLLGLHFPVSYYIPEFGGEGRDAVTVWHLLTHTAGFREADLTAWADVRAGIPVTVEPDQHPAVAEFLARRYGAPLWKRPGLEMSYCTWGYGVVGELIRRVSGMSFPDFARRRIFEPLGMKDTTFGLSESQDSRAVVMPADGPVPQKNERRLRDIPSPGSGAWSTADDMAVFGQLFLERGEYGGVRILSLPGVAAMTRNQLPGVPARYGEEVFPEASWSIGWSIVEQRRCGQYGEAVSASRVFCHGGAGGAFLWVDPEHQLVVSLLSATRTPVPGKILGDCRGLFFTAAAAAIEEA